MSNPYDIAVTKTPATSPTSTPNPYNVGPKQAGPVDAGFDDSPVGKIVNFFAAIPEATFDTGKSVVRSLFRIPAEFGISAAQAGIAIADKGLPQQYIDNAKKRGIDLSKLGEGDHQLDNAFHPIATDGLSTILGSEPLQGYAPQIESLAESIKQSSWAKSLGLDKHAFPLAFAGIVGGTAINFDTGGGQENVIKTIARESDPGIVFTHLIDIGVEKNAAAKAAQHLAQTSDPIEVKATLDTLQGLQAVHEAHSPVTDIAQQIQDELTHVDAKTARDMAEHALETTDGSPLAIEESVNKQIDYKIPELKMEASFLKEHLSEHPAKTLFEKYRLTQDPMGGGLGDIQARAMDRAGALKPGSKAWLREAANPNEARQLDSLVNELGYRDLEHAQEGVDSYKQGLTRLKELQTQIRTARGEAQAAKMEAKVSKQQVEAILQKDQSALSPAEAETVRKFNAQLPAKSDRISMSEGKPAQVFDRTAQEEAAASAGPQAIRDTVPLPPSVGDIIANGKRFPIEKTPADSLATFAKGPDKDSWQSLVKGYLYNAGPEKRAHIFDYLATPEFVLEKVGLARGAELLQDAKDTFRKTIKKEFTTIGEWQDRVASGQSHVNPGGQSQVHTPQDSSRLIFQWLDGHEREVTRYMSEEEIKVAQEVRAYLKTWAKRLNLPEDAQISKYITHIFERGTQGKDSFVDPELAVIMQDNVAKSVYDPFLQKRLGKEGYIEDAWRALDAYVKRASRKEAMDPALEEIANMAKELDMETYKYVKALSHRVNLRPTELEQAVDSFIKQTPVGYYFTERPTAFLSRKIRQTFYRGTLGLNFSSALRNLTQGANTYAKLGEKHTIIGYSKLFSRIVSRNLDELMHEGIIDDNLIQDQNIGVMKKRMQQVDEGLYAMFKWAETINRGAAYYGAKSKAISNGLSEEEAIKFAKRMVRETQFAFGAVDTPVFLNDDVVKTFTQLQTYNVKQAEFLGRMMKQKDFAGLIRWTAASIGMVYTIGRLFGMTPSQLIPTIGLGGAPLTSSLLAIKGMGSSDPQTHAKAVSQFERNLMTMLPAGAQLRKTVQGAQALHEGRSSTPTGRFRYRVPNDAGTASRALLFGPSALPQAQKYYNNLNKKKSSGGGGNPYSI